MDQQDREQMKYLEKRAASLSTQLEILLREKRSLEEENKALRGLEEKELAPPFSIVLDAEKELEQAIVSKADSPEKLPVDLVRKWAISRWKSLRDVGVAMDSGEHPSDIVREVLSWDPCLDDLLKLRKWLRQYTTPDILVGR